MDQQGRLDVIVFGVTGYTGMYVVENLIKTIEQENNDLKWGVAGRDEKKINKCMEEISKLVNKNLNGIPIIVADVSEDDSIMKMCKQARIIINCVGPYSLYGEVVVKNCILAKTHHVDIAGEPHFLEGMQLKYHDKAAEAGVLIVGACGFDSIPADVGIMQLKQHCSGEIAWVDTFAKTKAGPSGSVINHGTWDSALEFFANIQKTKNIRRDLYGKFFEKQFPSFKHRNTQKYVPYIPRDIGKLTVPFWETDKFVIKRTQLQNFIENNERPIQVSAYLIIGSWLMAIGLAFTGLLFILLASFSSGRKLLKRYPSFFTAGHVSHDGPSRQQVSEASFEMTLIGHGWKEKLNSPTEEPGSSPEQLIIGHWKGPEAGYSATSIILVQAAVTILKEQNSISYKGGVITPGLAFRNTTLVERLRRHSVSFEIIKKT